MSFLDRHKRSGKYPVLSDVCIGGEPPWSGEVEQTLGFMYTAGLVTYTPPDFRDIIITPALRGMRNDGFSEEERTQLKKLARYLNQSLVMRRDYSARL